MRALSAGKTQTSLYASILLHGPGVNDDRGGTFNTFVLRDDVSWSWGSHQFRFGGEGSYYELNRFNNFAARGTVTFGNATGLVGFQNFLLGRVTTTQGRAGFSTFYFRALDHSYYAQDDWKFNSRLTLNLGFRLEVCRLLTLSQGRSTTARVQVSRMS